MAETLFIHGHHMVIEEWVREPQRENLENRPVHCIPVAEAVRTVAETRRLSLVELAVVAMVARERPVAQTQEAVVAELLLKAAEAQVAAVLSSFVTTGKGGKTA